MAARDDAAARRALSRPAVDRVGSTGANPASRRSRRASRSAQRRSHGAAAAAALLIDARSARSDGGSAPCQSGARWGPADPFQEWTGTGDAQGEKLVVVTENPGVPVESTLGRSSCLQGCWYVQPPRGAVLRNPSASRAAQPDLDL